MGEPIRRLQPGDRIRLLNYLDQSIPGKYGSQHKGREKLLFNRRKGFAGLIDLNIMVDYLLYPRGLKAIPIGPSDDLKIIQIGKGRRVSEFSFKVAKQ